MIKLFSGVARFLPKIGGRPVTPESLKNGLRLGMVRHVVQAGEKAKEMESGDFQNTLKERG